MVPADDFWRLVPKGTWPCRGFVFALRNPDSNTRIGWDLGSLIMVLYDMVTWLDKRCVPEIEPGAAHPHPDSTTV